VTVRTRAHQGDTSFRLEVEDTGIGIAAADISRLFVEFQQLDEGASKRHSGTGLGLALTRRLVEAQGGVVGVESEPGKGSTFHATFPTRPLSGTPLPARRSFSGIRHDAPCVLVIEDSEHDQGVLVQVLVGAGYAVDTVSSGAQAMARCMEQRYDAITLDLLLPDLGGLELLRRLRQEGKNRDVPVIIVTVVTPLGAAAGFVVHDILPKPLENGALLESLQRAGVDPDRIGSVLVVDDDPGALKLMSTTLSRLGYDACCVGGGMEGLREAEANTPVAVVLDLMMPEMDGFEFLDRFRAIPRCRLVPVIVWTVKNLTAEEYGRLQETVQGVLSKGDGQVAGIVDELTAFLPVREPA
jgi:CheY-like chemotaxis protein